MIKIVSFDLQGTLSDGAFSDEFWLEILPELYAKIKCITLLDAKQILKEKFQAWGQYDYRYYSLNYWLTELNQKSLDSIRLRMKNKPLFFPDTLDILDELFEKKVRMIIISSTTREFIDAELGKYKRYFDKVYSTLDDFGVAGKPSELYMRIAQELNVLPEEIIHIGDCKLMDIENAKNAGLKTFFFDKKRSRMDVINELQNTLSDLKI